MTLAILDLLMCHACGTQFDVHVDQPLPGCRICDDPRQYVPPSGQRWTSLRKERDLTGIDAHQNHIVPLTTIINSNSSLAKPLVASPTDVSSTTSDSTPSVSNPIPDVHTMYTLPKLGIGERVILITTPYGTIMWDVLAYLDDDTIRALKAPPFNGIRAIVISHPHYYTNHLDWAEELDCPVYIAAEDEEWTNRKDVYGRRKLISGRTEEIVPGVTAIKVGGHFPGSLVLHWDNKLFIADSIVTLPSGLYHVDRPPRTNSYAFMWSIPNVIPLPPSELLNIWRAIEPFQFQQTHGAFLGQDIFDTNVKSRILESMKIQVRGSTGHSDHEIIKCSVELI